MNKKPKPVRPPLQSTRLLDQLRERIRYLHYSLRTEQTYVYWVRAFIRWHQLKHPAQMGKAEVEAYLSWLAGKRQVSSSTHRQALAALLFLYKEVLDMELPWLGEIGRPRARERLPTVLSRDEIERLLAMMDGEVGLLARLLYCTGMRLMEGLRVNRVSVSFLGVRGVYLKTYTDPIYPSPRCAQVPPRPRATELLCGLQRLRQP